MRLFAALEVPEDVCDEIAAWWSAASVHLPPGEWRDVPRRNWHLTLAFYGEVGGTEMDDLAEALAECAQGTAPLSLQNAGWGVFPRPARPRVFWAGIESPERGPGRTQDLKHLARCCRHAGRVTLRKHTAKSEPFRGHITLARAVPEASPLAAELWQELPDAPVLTWSAYTLALYASQLRPQGPRYRLVEAFELKGNHHVR